MDLDLNVEEKLLAQESRGEVNTIAVLTSGGDSPGMNAAIRSVVRTAKFMNKRVFGIRRGFKGLLASDIYEMNSKDVSDIIQRGGTILRSARCPEFHDPEVQKRAATICRVFGIEGLIVIGGNGTFLGARALSNYGINVVGIPATIDLDIPCSDYTIGFDTAVNTAMENIDKIRDTSASHERVSIVEVMGRDSGYIALWCGITSGAEDIIVPENPFDFNEIIKLIMENRQKGKSHNLIINAEGVGNSVEMAAKIEEITGIPTRATILGHLQRGGSPSAKDRFHASLMGKYAVELVCKATNRVVSYKDGKYCDFDINEANEMPYLFDNEKLLASRVISMRSN